MDQETPNSGGDPKAQSTILLCAPRPFCQDCELGCNETLHNPGLPTTQFLGNKPLDPPLDRKDIALLVVGEAPGFREDLLGEVFVGKSGQYLKMVYLEPGVKQPSLWSFQDHADVYLTNTVRCRPEQNEDPKPKYIKACRSFLEADYIALQEAYKSVVILCVGSIASKVVTGRKVTSAIKKQAQKCSVVEGLPEATVFCTFHPAMVLRDPSVLSDVKDHLNYLWGYLKGDRPPTLVEKVPTYLINCAPPNGFFPGAIVSMDIETYGAVEGLPKQNFYHPVKSQELDHVGFTQLIQTCAWTFKEQPEQADIQVFSRKGGPSSCIEWMRAAVANNWQILGQNIKFDIMYLRHRFPNSKKWFNHNSIVLLDTSILNYLHNEKRTAKSLKDLSALFGIAEYGQTLADDYRFPSSEDVELHRYNILDCLATRELWDFLLKEISGDYRCSEKMGPESLRWYSDLLWTTIYMSEAGVSMNRKFLQEKWDEVQLEVDTVTQGAIDQGWGPIRGKGSQPMVDALMKEAVIESGLLNNPRILKSKKTKKISVDKSNMTLVLQTIKEGTTKDRLQMLWDYKRATKQVDSYYRPLLLSGTKKQQMVGSIVYPDWYPVSGHAFDKDETLGGTIQCRITCKRPALQTAIKPVKAAIWTRWKSGYLIVLDNSQVELRSAGWLSGEPKMYDAYMADADIHRETASLIFQVAALEVSKKYRQAGKTINFGMLFRGNARTLSATLLKEIGLTYSVAECQTLIDRFFREYNTLFKWQNTLIKEATERGYNELPMVGASRLFWGGEQITTGVYESTIVNFPVQAFAANLLISAQGAIIRKMLELGLKSVSGLQIYDSLFIEGPLSELQIVKDLLYYAVRPPFALSMEKVLGRSFPLKAEGEVFIRSGDKMEKVDIIVESYKPGDPEKY